MSQSESLEFLVVDDDYLHVEMIKTKLKKIGYTNIKEASNYQEACEYLENNVPDLLILDYFLDKDHTGADLIREYLLNKEVPTIFISSYYGTSVLSEILEVCPVDFLPKNLSEFDLEKAIILSLNKRKENIKRSKLRGYIFVKHNREIHKIAVNEIEYLTVDGKYLELYSNSKKYLIRSTLNEFFKKLPDDFIKIHQAFIINLKYLVSINVDESTAKVGKVSLPVSRNFKKDLINSFYIP